MKAKPNSNNRKERTSIKRKERTSFRGPLKYRSVRKFQIRKSRKYKGAKPYSTGQSGKNRSVRKERTSVRF